MLFTVLGLYSKMYLRVFINALNQTQEKEAAGWIQALMFMIAAKWFLPIMLELADRQFKV